MARQKKKSCLYCYAPLCGRRDAKTCSDRCRKRLQRTRLLLAHDLEQKLVSLHQAEASQVNYGADELIAVKHSATGEAA